MREARERAAHLAHGFERLCVVDQGFACDDGGSAREYAGGAPDDGWDGVFDGCAVV